MQKKAVNSESKKKYQKQKATHEMQAKVTYSTKHGQISKKLFFLNQNNWPFLSLGGGGLVVHAKVIWVGWLLSARQPQIVLGVVIVAAADTTYMVFVGFWDANLHGIVE